MVESLRGVFNALPCFAEQPATKREELVLIKWRSSLWLLDRELVAVRHQELREVVESSDYRHQKVASIQYFPYCEGNRL